jgi:uncharacterized protein (TIGR02646 family)
MKHILKNAPPQYFTEYKATPNVSYDGLHKEELRLSLINEQKGLCAYCMSRINNDWSATHSKYRTEIEHYKSQELYPDFQLDYNNLLGVCNGNAGNPQHLLHCDKSKKGNSILTIDPLSNRCEDLCLYSSDGRIFSKDIEIDHDLNKKLNLNAFHLKNNRKNIIDDAQKRMTRFYAKKGNQDWSKADVEREIKYWEQEDSNGHFKEYCQIAIFYLKNKLKRIK